MRTLMKKTISPSRRSVDFSENSGRVDFRFPDSGGNTSDRRVEGRSRLFCNADSERDLTLSHLRNLVSSSISGYAEIGGSAEVLQLQTFAIDFACNTSRGTG